MSPGSWLFLLAWVLWGSAVTVSSLLLTQHVDAAVWLAVVMSAVAGFGAFVAGMRRAEAGATLGRGYTRWLALLAVLQIVSAFAISDALGLRGTSPFVYRLVGDIQLFVGLALVGVVFLRATGRRSAAAATAGISIYVLFFFPLGTATCVWWLWRTRRALRSKAR